MIKRLYASRTRFLFAVGLKEQSSNGRGETTSFYLTLKINAASLRFIFGSKHVRIQFARRRRSLTETAFVIFRLKSKRIDQKNVLLDARLTDKPSARMPLVFVRFSTITLLCRAKYRPVKPTAAKLRPTITAVDWKSEIRLGSSSRSRHSPSFYQI